MPFSLRDANFQYWLSSLLSVAHHTINKIIPTRGINIISCHHPLFPISCSLLAPTAKVGTITANEYIPPSNPSPDSGLNVPKIPSSTPSTREAIVLKSIKYQNSALRALPLNVVYFFRGVVG